MNLPAAHGTWLCQLAALPDGAARGFDPAGTGSDSLFLVRRGDEVHAWLDACPHMQGAAMAWRKDAYLSGDGRYIVCHAHGARFDIRSGLCLLGPCEGDSLTPVPIHIDATGAIHLAIEPF